MRREYIAWFNMPNNGKLHGQSVMPQQELIRCKDCKFRDIGENECGAWSDCKLTKKIVDADDYCSWAEREEE